jgi:hypothetical protein
MMRGSPDGMEWVRGAERLIESALRAVDAIPVEKLENYPKWQEARESVRRAGKGLADLRKLAAFIERERKSLQDRKV